ncbi:hypothetical protein EIN_406200, partial [Entamoeba invadens IP1]
MADSTLLRDSPLTVALTTLTKTLITSFSIFGVSPSTAPNTPTPQISLLYKYPESYEFPLKSEQFIVPQPPTISKLPSVSKEIMKKHPTQYVTMLPGEETSTICVCLRQNEFLNITSDLINPVGLTAELFKEPYYTQRTYCFTTTCPYFNCLFALLSQLSEIGYRNKLEYYYSFILRVEMQSPNFTVNPIKALLEVKLQQFMKLERPTEAINVMLGNNNKTTFPCSKVFLSSQKSSEIERSMGLVGDYSLIRLFCTMTVEDVLNTLCMMMCGYGVILLSDNVTSTSSCVLGLLTLFYPFYWPGIFIPYVPDILFEFFETPVPILCGGSYPPYKCKVNAYVEELDQGYWNYFTGRKTKYFDSVTLPEVLLPWRTELLNQLNVLVKTYVPTSPSVEEREVFIEMMDQKKVVDFSEHVRKVLREVLYNRLIQSVYNFCLKTKTDKLDLFIQKYPKQFYPKGYAFMKKFVES